MIYTGRYQARADAKSRLFLPADFRKLTEEHMSSLSFVMRRDIYQSCLVLYPESSWLDEVAALREKLNRWDKREAMIYRAFVSDTEIIRLDSQGRFIVPKRYAEILDDDRRVTFLGVDDRIELWRDDESRAILDELMSQEWENMFNESIL